MHDTLDSTELLQETLYINVYLLIGKKAAVTEIFFAMKVRNLKPSNVFLDAMDIMKLARTI